MGASTSLKSQRSITRVDTPVSTRDADRDYWSRKARKGDLRAWLKLAYCYELAGEFAEGLDIISHFLELPDLTEELRSEGLLRKAVFQMATPAIAWETIRRASLSVPDELKGKLHNQRGRILGCLKRYDEAILDHTAASVCFEAVGSPDLLAHTSNNLAGVYRRLKQFDDAHLWVDKAIESWADYEYLPHAFDHKALIYLDEKRYEDAKRFALRAVAGAGDHHKWSVEFLNTLAEAQAGCGEYSAALDTINKALELVDYLGDDNLRLKVYRTQKTVGELMYHASVESALCLALKLSAGSARLAAKLLGVNHSAVNNQIKKHAHLKHLQRK